MTSLCDDLILNLKKRKKQNKTDRTHEYDCYRMVEGLPSNRQKLNCKQKWSCVDLSICTILIPKRF